MATWKKVIVSGSTANLSALQVDNLTSGQVVIGGGTSNLSTTAINGTGTIVATTGASGLSHSGSFSGSFQGSFTGLITSASFATSASYALSASFATSASSAVSASFAPNIYNSDGTVSSTRNVTIPTSINLQFDSTAAGSTFTVKSAPDADVLISNLPTGTSSSLLAYNTATGKVVAMATSSIQNVVSSSFATSASFAISASRAVSASFAISASYALSASFAVSSSRAISASIATTASYVLQAVSASFASTASSIGNAITNNVNDYILTATGGGSINGEANLRFNGTTLTVTGNEVITGNLTVQGTASFQQTTNLEVADRFILLASGSNTTGDGGLVIQQATQNVGELFGYDSAVNRWAFTSSFTASQPSFTPAAFITTTEVGTIDPPAAPIYGGAGNGSGNIYVNTSTGDVFIYS
jgi:hypothetical protein